MASASEKFFNFVYEEYIPKVSTSGKLRSRALLLESFKQSRCDSFFYDLVLRIQGSLGLNKCVWGIKQVNNLISWEFYFYTYFAQLHDFAISDLIEILKPLIHCDFSPKEITSIPLFPLVSLDVDEGLYQTKKIIGFHVYVFSPSILPDGILCYSLTEDGISLENTYYFIDDDFKARVKMGTRSVFVDFNKINIDEVLIPELMNCKRIWGANKKESEAVYFEGIDIHQFIFFLHRFNFPQKFLAYVISNIKFLDHLQYDVGFDYKMEDGKLKITKSGFYGTF